MKNRTYKFSISVLALIILIAITAIFGINFIPAKAEGSVTVSGTNVFTASGEASVIADQQKLTVDEKEETVYYTMFTFADEEDVISYRRNLAYYWMYGAEDVGLFSMEIGLKNTDFERFLITFESQQFNKTKDSKSVNYIIFYPAEDGKVNVLITDDKEETLTEEGNTTLEADHIKIEFTSKLSGAYAVSVGNEGGASVKGTLKNVGGNFAKSSTSSTSPVYPLIFNAEFAESDQEIQPAKMVLYSLNGQWFEVKSPSYDDDNDYYYGGTVTDNVSPVLCLGEEVRYFKLGGELDIDYTVIDVLRSSPSSTVNYYILTYDMYTDEEITDFQDKELFAEVSDDLLIETDIDKYLPVDELAGTKFNAYNADGETEKLTVDMAIKVYININDTTSNGTPADIYLDWYLPEDYKIKINGCNYIAVADDELGVTYNYSGKDGKSWDKIKEEYQTEVTKLAKDLSAGSSSYLYLPSAENLFSDNATAYTDMKLSIYYYHDSQQSNTSLSTSNLSINVTKQGKYTFTIYATDAAGNNMYYIKDGKVETFATSDIWDMFEDEDNEGLYDLLPWFSFDVSYTGVQFEESPGKQSTAYVGTSYSSASFKINGISGSYETKYRLFLFNSADYYEATGITYGYEEFIKVMDDLFADSETRFYFEEILAVTEDDPEYEKYKDYGWSNSSTTFTPQVTNAFYYIRAEVTDTQYNTDPVTCGLAVVASVNAKTLKGESDWLQKNVASVVLFAIAGIAFIALIILFIIKPKDNDDVDLQFEKQKSKKDKKNK